MKWTVSRFVARFVIPLVCCLSIESHAGSCSPIPANASAGQKLYCETCASCHGEAPSIDSNARKAANNASILQKAFSTVGSMQFLNGVFNNTDLHDIVTYIADPTVSVTTSTLSVVASQVSPVAGSNILLSAFTYGRVPASTVTFRESGTALSGCASVPVLALPGATTSGVATCKVSAIKAGRHDYTLTHTAAGGTSEQALLTVNTLTAGPLDYTDMWWAGTVEDGWGLSITQHTVYCYLCV